MRMFFRALIEAVDPSFEDPRFGSYKVHDKGGCEGEYLGNAGGGCLREFFDYRSGIRITFSFKTFASQKTLALDWLISPSQQPDVFLTATGAWDLHRHKPKDPNAAPDDKCDLAKSCEDPVVASGEAVAWTRALAQAHPSSLVLAATLVNCAPYHVAAKAAWNRHFLAANLDKDEGGRIAVLDRAPITPVGLSTKTDGRDDCNDFHAFNNIALAFVHGTLRALCRDN